MFVIANASWGVRCGLTRWVASFEEGVPCPSFRLFDRHTWRTFVTNHLGQFSFDSYVRLPYDPDTYDTDESCLPCRQPRLSRDALYAHHQAAAVDWRDSCQPTPSRRCSKIALTTASRFETEAGAARRHSGLPTLACTSRKTIDSLNAGISAPNQPGNHLSRG